MAQKIFILKNKFLHCNKYSRPYRHTHSWPKLCKYRTNRLFKITCKTQPQNTGCLQSHMLTTGLLYNLQHLCGCRGFFFTCCLKMFPSIETAHHLQ